EAAIRKNKPQSRKMKSGDKPPMGDLDPVNRRRFCNRGQSSLTADTQSPIVQKNFDIGRGNPRERYQNDKFIVRFIEIDRRRPAGTVIFAGQWVKELAVQSLSPLQKPAGICPHPAFKIT